MSWVPDSLLAKWLLLVGTIATFSGIQSFVDVVVNRKVYTKAGASVTPLSGRLFAIWNFASAAIRISCAYDMQNAAIYRLTIFSFILALAHFSTEVFVYKTATFNAPGTLSPLIVASTSTIAMLVNYPSFIGGGK